MEPNVDHVLFKSVLYLPCLKNLVKQTKEKKNEVFMWYAQIVSYVYVPLLLQLSNDVEKNPGPTNVNEIVPSTFTVCADFNQGNASMFGSNTGKQCVAMLIYAILYNEIKSINTWDTSIMNRILINGNNLYSVISQHVQKDFLLLTEIPEIMSINSNTFHVKYSESFSGALLMIITINLILHLNILLIKYLDLDIQILATYLN